MDHVQQGKQSRSARGGRISRQPAREAPLRSKAIIDDEEVDDGLQAWWYAARLLEEIGDARCFVPLLLVASGAGIEERELLARALSGFASGSFPRFDLIGHSRFPPAQATPPWKEIKSAIWRDKELKPLLDDLRSARAYDRVDLDELLQIFWNIRLKRRRGRPLYALVVPEGEMRFRIAANYVRRRAKRSGMSHDLVVDALKISREFKNALGNFLKGRHGSSRRRLAALRKRSDPKSRH